jgi:hypothetical protein
VKLNLPNALILAGLMLIASTACYPGPKDISKRPEIQSNGLIGAQLILKQDAAVHEEPRPFRRRRLVTSASPSHPAIRGPVIWTVAAGTHLRVEKVVEATFYWDILFTMMGTTAYARLEDGPHSGTLVDIGFPSMTSIEAGTDASFQRAATTQP